MPSARCSVYPISACAATPSRAISIRSRARQARTSVTRTSIRAAVWIAFSPAHARGASPRPRVRFRERRQVVSVEEKRDGVLATDRQGGLQTLPRGFPFLGGAKRDPTGTVATNTGEHAADLLRDFDRAPTGR